jgi:multicomponent Na+:H+ antiporter subunit F
MNDQLIMILLGILSLVFPIVLIRVWRGPSTADRVVAFDVVMAAVVGICGLCVLLYQASSILDILLVLATLSFVSSVGFAYFIESERP